MKRLRLKMQEKTPPYPMSKIQEETESNEEHKCRISFTGEKGGFL